MKTIVLVLMVLIALPCVASAQLYPSLDSLQRYVTDFADIGYTGTDDMDSLQIRRMIFWGLLQTCNDFPALEKITTIVIDSSASEGGVLPTDFIMAKEAFIISGDTLRIPLLELFGDTLFLGQASILGHLMDVADLYSIKYYHTHASSFLLHPKWSRGDALTILLEYYARDTTTFATAADSTKIRHKFLEKVVQYATSLVWAVRGNFDKSNYWLGRYKESMGKNVD